MPHSTAPRPARPGAVSPTRHRVDLARRHLLASLPGLSLAGLGSGLLGACATGVSGPPLVSPGDAASMSSGAAMAAAAIDRSAAASVLPFSLLPADGSLPLGWSPYVIRRDLPRTDYAMASLEGRAVLHATARGARSGLHCAVNADPRATPWLRWQWRVDALHEEATVADDDAEDTPARLVVGFEGEVARLPLRDRLFYEQVELFTGIQLPFATLTYVWDGQLPIGSVLPYVRSARIQYLVVESGTARGGRWLTYERNLFDDFMAVFGQAPPGRISSVGLMTDSDDLKNEVEAWYGDIGLFADAQAAA